LLRRIREKLSGMQAADGVHWRDVCNRDGTLRSYSDGKGRVGKWTVKKDELCIYFKDPDDSCYEVSDSGDRIEMKPAGLGLSIEGVLQQPTDRD
jgi:hypothetical protein